MSEQDIQKIIDNLIKSHDVILFIKGSKNFPQCGFSATVVEILTNLGINFKDINVLENQDIRNGIKIYSDWPTIPQLYVKGNFIGGCDIIKTLYEQDKLNNIFKI
jgi:monothiol glutaredoxin